MTESSLVPVFAGTLAGQPAQLCNARDLHAFLGVGRDFTNWIRARIEEYGFAEGEDFAYSPNRTDRSEGRSPDSGSGGEFSPDLAKNHADRSYPPDRGNSRGGRGRPRAVYHLSLDMAKELAMIENSDRGREVRRYFIALERRAQQQAAAAGPRLPGPGDGLPPEIRRAINRHAYALSHEAYERLRDWLAERAVQQCRTGHGVWLAPDQMLAASSLTDFLAAYHANRARQLLLAATAIAELSAQWAQQLERTAARHVPEVQPGAAPERRNPAYELAAAGAFMLTEKEP